MKKAIVVILAICLSLGMFACNKEENKNEILGEWIAVTGGASAVFNPDGTGEVASREITWKYDAELECYIIADKINYNATIYEDSGIQFMKLLNAEFCRADDYDQAFNLMISKKQEEYLNLVAMKEEIQIGKSYELAQNVSIQFTKIQVESDNLLIAYYDITNNGAEGVTDPLQSNYEGKYLRKESGGIQFSGTYSWCSSIEPEQTIQNQGGLCDIDGAKETIEAYGAVYGVVWFDLGGKQYYVDLSDYFKN